MPEQPGTQDVIADLNDRGQADRALDLILAFGPDQDRVRARAYFERARDDHEEPDMAPLLTLTDQ